MKLFHGTSDYALQSFLKEGPRKYPRHYLPRSKRAFCTSESFDEASIFAIRKTPISSSTITGIVLEFDGTDLTMFDFIKARDPVAMRDEAEISITNTKKLKLVAYWQMVANRWKRNQIK